MAAPIEPCSITKETCNEGGKYRNEQRRISKSEKKVNRKLVKCAKILEKHAGITICKYSTRNLVLSNCGLTCGGTYDTLHNVLKAYGNVETVVLLPEKPYAFAVYSDVQEAANAVAALTGTVPSFAATPVYLGYVETVPQLKADAGSSNPVLPPGLELILDAVSEEEEAKMLSALSWNVGPHQTLKRRDVQHFGYEFQYERTRVNKDSPLEKGIPHECHPFLERTLRSGYLTELPDQLTVNRYRPGQGIASHVDSHWSFEDGLVCLSLGAAVVMDFRNPRTGVHVPVFLPVRSAAILRGESRYLWMHGIAARKTDTLPSATKNGQPTVSQRSVRTSFTFRKVRRRDGCDCEYKEQCDTQQERLQQTTKKLADAEAAILEGSHVHEVYEAIASHFSETRHKEWPQVAQFLDSVPEGSLLLDVGCGNGKYLTGHDHVLKVGLERSRGLASICRARGIEVAVGDALALPWRDASFDACLCIAVIHHLATPERRQRSVAEMLRVLRPGGLGLVYVWAFEQENGGQNSNYVKPSRAKRGPAGSKGPHDLPVHINRTPFSEPDVLVPWHKKPAEGDCSSAPLHRFYHVFRRGELRALVEDVLPGSVRREYYDQGNWCVVVQKSLSRQ